jgi:hypothetical protein
MTSYSRKVCSGKILSLLGVPQNGIKAYAQMIGDSVQLLNFANVGNSSKIVGGMALA